MLWHSQAHTHYDVEVEGELGAAEGAEQGTYYDVEVEGGLAKAEEGSTQGEVHWEGPEWYCWD